MFHLMIQKIIHKKWLAASLLIGNILLVAIAISHPMYQEAAKKRMLLDGFNTYMQENDKYPMRLNMSGILRGRAGVKDTQQIRELAETICGQYGLPEKEKICLRELFDSCATSRTIHDGRNQAQKLSITSMSGLESHIKLLGGEMYADSIKDNCIEAIISQSGMVGMNLLLGEIIEYDDLYYEDGSKIRIKVVGVFTNSEDVDVYWKNSPDYYKSHLFIASSLFEDVVMANNSADHQINEEWYVLPDYTALEPKLVDNIVNITSKLEDSYKTTFSRVYPISFLDLMKDYQLKEKQITVTLSILQIPVIVLLCAFLFMIAKQMFEMEENEIALLKSRGAKRKQILLLYLYQALFLAVIGFVAGLPLGSLMCRILGASSAFLTFVNRRALDVQYTGQVFLYGLLAVILSVSVCILPVLKHDKASIVAVKRKRSRRARALWQKLYLDVVFIAVSLYGFFNFRQQQEQLLSKVIEGETMDPMLFLSSSLFILGVGMFSLRIHGLLIKILYAIRKKKWQPATYTSFLQLIRTGNKQAFIMVFLVLTVAFGMFNMATARTILSNAEANKEYMVGADIVLKEYWEDNSEFVTPESGIDLAYIEPDMAKYDKLKEAKAVAKVYRNDNATAKINRGSGIGTVLAIDTQTFGEVTNIEDGLLAHKYREYLNVLSRNPGAVLLSSNFRDKLGLKIGDRLSYAVNETGYSGTLLATVYGFFDYWPTYAPTTVTINPDGTTETKDNYMVVAHLSTVQDAMGICPYEVWIDMDGDTAPFYDFAEEQGMSFKYFTDTEAQKREIGLEPLFQGTSGILTMSFITILLICSIGYLIYWTLSIRSRELMFGIFRAMGMSRREIMHMLINEQILTGCVAIGFGVGIGWLASRLYVPIIQIAYSDSARVLPLKLITQNSDLVRLLVIIGVVFVACLVVIIRQVLSMKISQALKLGED